LFGLSLLAQAAAAAVTVILQIVAQAEEAAAARLLAVGLPHFRLALLVRAAQAVELGNMEAQAVEVILAL
jgi:hypothetical protein